MLLSCLCCFRTKAVCPQPSAHPERPPVVAMAAPRPVAPPNSTQTVYLMRLRLTALAAWSGVAVLLAHDLGYRFTYADAHARMHALEATGHGWYATLLPALVLTALVAVLSTAQAAKVAAHRVSRAGAASRMWLTAVMGFVAIEFVERWVHLGSFSEVVHNVSSLAGAVPILVAVALLALLVPAFMLLVRVVEHFASSRTRLASARLPIIFSALSVFHGFSPAKTSPPRAPPYLF
jgi:hypothetical protein